MVARAPQTDKKQNPRVTTNARNSTFRTQTRNTTPTDKDAFSCFQYIRQALGKRGISEKSQNIILNSWRKGTKLQYNTYVKKWIYFCEGKTNPLSASVNTVIEFLTFLVTQGLSYSTINTARSAVSNFLKITRYVNIHHDGISRFMKGVFNEKPSLPRYTRTWDVRVVLQYLKTMDITSSITLSCKLAMLFLLVTAQRCQTLHVIKLGDIDHSPDGIVINISQLIKQSRPGVHLAPIVLNAYKTDESLCIVKTLNTYITRTKGLRKDDNLLISTTKPHGKISKQTVARWIKNVLKQAGLPTVYTAHSTRAATASNAYDKGVPLQNIIKAAGWSNARTFATYYKRKIENDNLSVHQALME